MDFIQKLLDTPGTAGFSAVWHAEKPRMNMQDSLDGKKVLAYLSFPLPPPKAMEERFLQLWNAEEPHIALGFFQRGYKADFARPEVRMLFERCLAWGPVNHWGVGRVDPLGTLDEFESDWMTRHQRDQSNRTLLDAIGMLFNDVALDRKNKVELDKSSALLIATARDLIETAVVGIELFESYNGMKALRMDLLNLDSMLQHWDWTPFFGLEFPANATKAIAAESCVPIEKSNSQLPFWQRVFVNRPELTPAELDELTKGEE